jgi:ubiquinone/menaquinone biosynthesis C-methylase UbiE
MNTEDSIRRSYENQAGEYVWKFEHREDVAKYKLDTAAEIVSRLKRYSPQSMLEAGVGEATVLFRVLQLMPLVRASGLDLGPQRLKWAKKWLQSHGLDAELIEGGMSAIPMPDRSFDAVYTSHAIEPNGGNERTLLRELVRVARRCVVLVEPSYEIAGPDGKARMESLGYCKGLESIARSEGWNVVEHAPLLIGGNPLNPPAITVIEI